MTLSKKSKWGNIALLLVLSLPGITMANTEDFSFGHVGTSAKADRTVKLVTLDAMQFTPDTLHVRPGETVRFIVTNKGKLTHEFIIGDAREQAEHEQEMQKMPSMDMPNEPNGIMLKPGQTKTLIWTFGQGGEVEFACHVPGHFAAGMVGKILVNANTR